MAKWTYLLTIINDTDRTLELVSSSVPWGKRDGKFPETISAGQHGDFKVYSPAGNPTGLEFYFTMRDKPNTEQETRYGSFSVAVDVPYWKHNNTSSFTCNGILTQSGFKEIPNGAHDFATTATITTTLCSDSINETESSEVKPELNEYVEIGYSNLYDWDKIQNLEVINPHEKTVDYFIPDQNIILNRKLDGRTEKASVPRIMWNEIIDRKCPDAYSKRHFVEDYFTVSVYEVRKNTTVSIPANQSYEKTLEITNRSTVRRETRQELQIENTISGSGTSGDFTLSDTLRMQYQISKLDEYCSENIKTVREVFNYNAVDQDRNVVLWDLAEVLVLYRTSKKGQTELVGIGDYYLTASQKTYMAESNSSEDIDNSMIEAFQCPDSITNSRFVTEDDDISDDESYFLLPSLGAIQGNITINGTNYRWMELSFGTNRGMCFNPGNNRYEFRPNPHNDPWYNRNQATWYANMAREFKRIGDAAAWNQNNWPAAINNLRVNGITYTASAR